ncbi:MAG: type transporter [Frankiales bacterium]|nr:type transporter [Frankiales bacterium]
MTVGDRTLPVVRLVPTGKRPPLRLSELWDARELVFFLAQRDVKLRYRQTVLGAVWVLLQPLLTVLIFSVVFGRLARVSSDGQPYAVFALAGLVPWTFVSTSLATTSLSLVTNASLVGKVWFPRLAVPLAAALAGLVDLLVGLGLLLVVAVVRGDLQPLRLLALPLLVVLALVAVLGPGTYLAAVNVRYRDVRYVVPFLVQCLLFVSPVAYPTSLVPHGLRLLYAVNPYVGVVEGFRWALLGGSQPVAGLLAVSTASSLVLLLLALRSFRAREATFADVL